MSQDERVQIEVAGGKTMSVTPGVIDAAAELAYCHGQCHALAVAMHRKRGWPIISIEGRVLPEEMDYVIPGLNRSFAILAMVLTPLPSDSRAKELFKEFEQQVLKEVVIARHYCVLSPDDLYIDITGAHTLEEFLKQRHLFDAGAEDLHQVSVAEVEQANENQPTDYAIADLFVEPLLEKYYR